MPDHRPTKIATAADRVKAAVVEVNNATAAAAALGISVEFEIIEHQTMEGPLRHVLVPRVSKEV
ncbi:hypothetical protein [Celeribacter halophilus]|uniref:Uncharacterized protein n=1 Tax=Celeribacter halophilus TaxID=576117 RepID=A0A1I3XAB5_9RHOB|nr:hypothetical protein [Celeribacter halophilus]PZX03770.1 hypothetical protein LX82_03747 [Celeribacter halophilus]SFK16568.1 hypothetical protein SAMN04488138_1464 [Celeribacter halophilus]